MSFFILKMATLGPSQISDLNYFSSSKFLCCSDASHQVLTQSALRFVRRCILKKFKMVHVAAILDVGMERIYQFRISLSPHYLPPSFSLIRLNVPEQMSFQAGVHGGHRGYCNGTNLAILNPCQRLCGLTWILTHLCRMDFASSTHWPGPLPIEGMSGSFL